MSLSSPNPRGLRPARYNVPAPLPINASVGQAKTAGALGYTNIDHGWGNGTLTATNAQGERVTSDKNGRFPEQVQAEQAVADENLHAQQAVQERQDQLAKAKGIVPSTAKYDGRGNLIGGIHAGDGSVFSTVNGKLVNDGKANPALLQRLQSGQPATTATSSPADPQTIGKQAATVGQNVLNVPRPLGTAAPTFTPDQTAMLRDVGAASRQDGLNVPVAPAPAPAPSVADAYRSGSNFNTLQATRDYTSGRISADDLAHVQSTAARVGSAPVAPAYPNVPQPLGRQYGSARIIPTTMPAPALPSANDPQHTVATKLSVPGGGTVTIPAYAGPAQDGGVYVNGKPMTHTADGRLVADLTRSSGSGPAAAPTKGGYASGLGGVATPAPASAVAASVLPDAGGYASGLGGTASPATVPAGQPAVASPAGTRTEVPLAGPLATARDAAQEAGIHTGNPGVIDAKNPIGPVAGSWLDGDPALKSATPAAPLYPNVPRPPQGLGATSTGSFTPTVASTSPSTQSNFDSISSLVPGAKPEAFKLNTDTASALGSPQVNVNGAHTPLNVPQAPMNPGFGSALSDVGRNGAAVGQSAALNVPKPPDDDEARRKLAGN